MSVMRKFVYTVEVVVDEDPQEHRRELLNTILALEFEHLITGRSFAIPGKVAGDTGNLHFVVQSTVVVNHNSSNGNGHAGAGHPTVAVVPMNGLVH